MTHILFIQGAGEGAYKEALKMAGLLQGGLGNEYKIHCPPMPYEDSPDYEKWKPAIAKEIKSINEDLVFIGHSLGGSVLLKFLTEENISTGIKAIFSAAAPFWNGEDSDWESDEFALKKEGVQELEKIPLFFYHNKDDEIVKFNHLKMYADKFPNAKTQLFNKGGHMFIQGLSKIIEDIKTVR